MNNILKKHIISLVASVVFCLAAIIGTTLFFRYIKSKIAEVTGAKELVATYRNNEKAFSEEAAQVKTLELRLNDIESNIVTNKTLPNLLSNFENLAKNSKIGFEIISVQTPNINGREKMLIDFRASGSYANIQKFLNQIQHQAVQINLSKLQIFAERNQNVSTSFNATLEPDALQTSNNKENQWQVTATIEVLSF